MGLYDTLHCNYPLPRPAMQENEFQTKSLNCELDYWTITADGKLISGYEGASDYSGEIRFYDFENEEPDGRLIDFIALFQDGQLLRLYEATEATEADT